MLLPAHLSHRGPVISQASTGGGGTPTGPIIGMNVRADGGGGLRTAPNLRLADFGRIPMARNPYYGIDALPATFNADTTVAPEQRCQISFKRLPSGILDGSWDSRITGYVSSIPAGWYVVITYWHEPNGEIPGTFTATDFKAAWYRIGSLIQAAPKTAGTTVIPAPNFTGPGGATFDNTWVPDVDLMPSNSLLTIDKYGNPPPPINQALDATATYGGLYRAPGTVYDQTVQMISDTGWANKWAITEWNYPRKDNDAAETYRVQVMDDAMNYFLTRTTIGLPRFVLLWEGNGVQFDQNMYQTATRDWWKSWVATSP